jgi:hypothetical protein
MGKARPVRGQDISNELQNKIPVILSEPVHTPEVLASNVDGEEDDDIHDS